MSIYSLILIWSRLHDRWGDIMRDYMDRRVTLPKQFTSPTWGPPPPCKQALNRPFRLSLFHLAKLPAALPLPNVTANLNGP